MKLDDDFDLDYKEYNNSKHFKQSPMYTYTLLSVVLVMITILGIVLLTNNKPQSNHSASANMYSQTVSGAEAMGQEQYNLEKSVDELISGSTLVASDLDFWDDDYGKDKNKEKNKESSATSSTSENALTDGAESDKVDPSNNGNKTCITYSDGTEEWIDINPYLVTNPYNNANLVNVNNIMKYYDNHVNTSFVGVDLSKNDDYVDFNKLKNAGVDYVMLRVGSRGYSTGDIIADDNFADNYKRAREAGLDVGVYFFSQAITKDEAVEEANFVIETISGNEIKYPVVYYIEEVNSADVRTKDLNQMLRTNIAIAFMDSVRNAGYVPMLYGNKEYLLKKCSFGSLTGYDIWLGENGDIPDFPYEFNMWRYTNLGKIDGVAGVAHLNICFTDYSGR